MTGPRRRYVRLRGAEVESYTAGAHWWRLYIQGNMTHTMMYNSGARERDAETAGGGRGAGTHTHMHFISFIIAEKYQQTL